MPQVRGSDTSVALYEQVTYNVDPGTPSGTKLYVVSNGMKGDQSLIRSNTITASRGRARPGRGNINVAGQIATELSAENIGLILKHAMGAVATTGAGPFSHALTLDNLPIGLIVENDNGTAIVGAGRCEKFGGSRVSKAAFNFPNEGMLTVNFDMMGAENTLTSAPLDATLTDNGHTPFTGFQAAYEEGGASIGTITDLNFTLDNELDAGIYAGGGAGVRRALPEQFATVTGSMTVLYEDAVLMNKAISDTSSSIKITVSRGDGLGTAGNESVTFFLQNLVYARTSPGIPGPAGMKATFNFETFVVGADNGLLITINNALSTI